MNLVFPNDMHAPMFIFRNNISHAGFDALCRNLLFSPYTTTNQALHQQNPLHALGEDASKEWPVHSYLYFFISLSRGKWREMREMQKTELCDGIHLTLWRQTGTSNTVEALTQVDQRIQLCICMWWIIIRCSAVVTKWQIIEDQVWCHCSSL